MLWTASDGSTRDQAGCAPSGVHGITIAQADYDILAGFRTHVRRFFAFSEAATKAAGVPNRHYQAMLAIKADGGTNPVTITNLAEHLQIQLNSAVELVGRMEASGLIQRSRAISDARRIELRLTVHGAALLETLAAKHLEHHREHVAELLRCMQSVS